MWQPFPVSSSVGLCKYTNYYEKYVHIAWFLAGFQAGKPQTFLDMNL